MDIKNLSMEEKIAQMFIAGLKNKKRNQIKQIIKKQKVGGVVLYRNNYHDYSEMLELVNFIKKENQSNEVPIFISIDQEGGRVNRMPDEILKIRNATKLASTNSIELVRESGKIIGKILKETGISLNYAPVLDINRYKENRSIGDRCFGEDVENVIKYGIEVMKAEQEEGIIASVKHFPGHGMVNKDSHNFVIETNQKKEQIEKEDMLPFIEAIKEGADSILVGHILIKDIDKKYPASLSKKIINGYLIEKYNFKGLIVTDDIKMKSIGLRYNYKKAVYKAIEAGNDMIMIGLSHRKIMKAIRYINKLVKKGKISRERIDQSVKKSYK